MRLVGNLLPPSVTGFGHGGDYPGGKRRREIWPCVGVPPPFVMPGLDPGIHAFWAQPASKTWMAGTSPAMTNRNIERDFIWARPSCIAGPACRIFHDGRI